MTDIWIVTPAFSVSGEPAPRKKGDALLVRHRQKILAQAYYHLARRAISTPAGYATDSARLALLDRDIEPLRVACAEFAAHAEAQHSARRIRVEIYAHDLPPAAPWDARVRLALDEARVERLAKLRDALDAGDVDAVDGEQDACRNLDVLEPGAAEILEAVRLAKLELSRAARRGQTPGPSVGTAVSIIELAIHGDHLLRESTKDPYGCCGSLEAHEEWFKEKYGRERGK